MSKCKEVFSKNEFKLLLDKLLNRELEELRKKFWAYKRRQFLRNKVKIYIGKCEKGIAGYYANTREKDKQYKYTHKIYITKNQILSYKRFVKWHMKRLAIDELREIIRHELIHAFVHEEFEIWESIKHTNGDYSPIFLSCLYWGKGITNHTYADSFLETELWKEISVCKTYDEVYIKLIKFISNLEKSVREINKNINNVPGDYKELEITFNTKGAGIIKDIYLTKHLKIKNDNKICYMKVTNMVLGIGFLVTPEILMDNYKRKFNNGILAKSHSEEIIYVIDNKVINQSTLIDNIA